MLALSRKKNEALVINNDIELTVLEVKGDQVTISDSAGRSITLQIDKDFSGDIDVELTDIGALTVQIGGLRAGWLPLPGRLAEKIAEQLIADLAQEPEYQKATEIVKEASLQADGTLVVTFVPTKIPALLALLMQGR